MNSPKGNPSEWAMLAFKNRLWSIQETSVFAPAPQQLLPLLRVTSAKESELIQLNLDYLLSSRGEFEITESKIAKFNCIMIRKKTLKTRRTFREMCSLECRMWPSFALCLHLARSRLRLYRKELPFLRMHLIPTMFGKPLRIFPLLVYDVSRFTENPHCSSLKELHCGTFLILISPVVDVLNLEERPSKRSMKTHGSARKRFVCTCDQRRFSRRRESKSSLLVYRTPNLLPVAVFAWSFTTTGFNNDEK